MVSLCEYDVETSGLDESGGFINQPTVIFW